MTYLSDKDEKILLDYLQSYKDCFEAMNDLLNKLSSRIELTEDEIEMAKVCDMKYKNMIYYVRKWNPQFRKLKGS